MLPQINEEEASLLDMLWLLLASVVFVPMFQKIPGGTINLKTLKASRLFATVTKLYSRWFLLIIYCVGLSLDN